MVTWQFQKSLPPLLVRIFISDLTLHRLQWPAAASRDSNTWKYWQLVACTAKLLHKPCKATLPRKPFQDCHPSTSFLISGSNYYLQLLLKRLWFSIGCSQISWVMGEEKESNHCWPEGQRHKGPSFRDLSSRWNGSTRELFVQGKNYKTVITEKVRSQWNFRFCIW